MLEFVWNVWNKSGLETIVYIIVHITSHCSLISSRQLEYKPQLRITSHDLAALFAPDHLHGRRENGLRVLESV